VNEKVEALPNLHRVEKDALTRGKKKSKQKRLGPSPPGKKGSGPVIEKKGKGGFCANQGEEKKERTSRKSGGKIFPLPETSFAITKKMEKESPKPNTVIYQKAATQGSIGKKVKTNGEGELTPGEGDTRSPWGEEGRAIPYSRGNPVLFHQNHWGGRE